MAEPGQNPGLRTPNGNFFYNPTPPSMEWYNSRKSVNSITSNVCSEKSQEWRNWVWRPFNIHEVGPFQVAGDVLWCKGFLIKGFTGHSDRDMHTRIFCFWQYLKLPVRQVQETAAALRVQHGLYMAYTSLRIWRNLQGIRCFSTYWHLQSSLNHAWEASGTCSSQNTTLSSQGI